MTAPLRDLLDELADAAPAPRVDVAAAWAGGRRERRQRAWSRVTAAAAVLALLALVVPVAPAAVPAFAGGSGTSVDGHPSHVGTQLVVPPLPDRPGPLALVVAVHEPDGTGRRRVGWDGVTASGWRYRLPAQPDVSDAHPTLSPDGRYLGLLEGLAGPYVVRDLVTGERSEFRDVGANVLPAPARFAVHDQVPGHWAPDGSRLLLGRLLLDLRTGSAAEVSVGSPVGFDGPDRLVALQDQRPQGALRLVTSDLGGREVASVVLRARPGTTVASPSQWTGTLTPSSVVLTDDGGFGGTPGTRWFSRETGAETGQVPLPQGTEARVQAVPGTEDVVRTVRDVRVVDPGEVPEVGDTGLPREPELDTRIEVRRVGTDGQETVVTTLDPDLDPDGVAWAERALVGPARRGWASRAAGVGWPVPAGAAAVLVVAGLVAVRRRRAAS